MANALIFRIVLSVLVSEEVLDSKNKKFHLFSNPPAVLGGAIRPGLAAYDSIRQKILLSKPG